MNATLELLERYKLALSLRADSAAARALGVKTQTVSNWRTRGSQAEPWVIEKMCAAIGVPTAPWLLHAQFAQAPDASNKQVWRRVAQSLGCKLGGLAAFAGVPGAQWLLGDGMPLSCELSIDQGFLASLAAWTVCGSA
ncbi:MAG TPA: hypothetical protein VFT52_07480 [Luteimonas sp.]|jgi:hypothetical protein|nr:hypothetical protein [Luteimonas sp.]